jgi:putative hydrolase of the HAD superfamily
MSKKAIIFDVGGVLIDLDINDCKEAFRRDLGYEKIDDILDPCHQKGIVGDMEEGLITAEEFRAAVLKDARPGARPEEVDDAFMHILAGIPSYKGQLLNHLAKSYDIYILSNNNPIVSSHMSELFAGVGVDYENVFKKSFLSFEMKALKPSEAFYKRVLEQIDCRSRTFCSLTIHRRMWMALLRQAFLLYTMTLQPTWQLCLLMSLAILRLLSSVLKRWRTKDDG